MAQIGSIIIGSLERVSRTLLRGFEIVKDSGDRIGSARMNILADPDAEAVIGSSTIGSATLGVAINPGQEIRIYESLTVGDPPIFGEPIFGEPIFGEGESTSLIFRGEVVKVEPKVLVLRRLGTSTTGTPLFGDPVFGGPLFGDAPGYERINLIQIECRDLNYILENTIVSTASYLNETDQNIIQGLLATYAPEIDSTNVSLTTTLASFDIREESLRNVLARLEDRTGAVFYLDQNFQFHWFLPTAHPSSFGFSEEPDGVATFSFYRDSFQFNKEWRAGANKVTVIGQVSGTDNISASREDVRSQAAYGVKQRRIVDRQITTTQEAELRADVELARDAWPITNGTLRTRKEGVLVGSYLPINASYTLRLNGSFVVRRVRMTWLTPLITEYEVEWGDYLPDLVRAIRRLAELAKPIATPPVSIPATGSVTPGSLASTLEFIEPVVALPALPHVDYDANSLVLLTSVTPRRLYRVSGTDWVSVTKFDEVDGQVLAGQLAADSVIAGTIAAGAIRAADAAFELAAIQTADIANLAVTGAKIGTAEITSAKIGNLEVQSINIANSAVGNTQLGTGAVDTINIINGAVGSLQIASLAVTNAHIADLSASKITAGTINVGSGGINIDGTAVTALQVRDSGTPANLSRMWGGSAYMTRSAGGDALLSCSWGSATTALVAAGPVEAKVEVGHQSGDYVVQMAASSTDAYLVVSNPFGQSSRIKAYRNGWGVPTGGVIRATWDSGTITHIQLANVVAALVQDLMTHHILLGA